MWDGDSDGDVDGDGLVYSELQNLDELQKLTQLSIEDNEISSLKGISVLTNLMELYIGNNKISSLKEVLHLRSLKRLIILDVSGNDICKVWVADFGSVGMGMGMGWPEVIRIGIVDRGGDGDGD